MDRLTAAMACGLACLAASGAPAPRPAPGLLFHPGFVPAARLDVRLAPGWRVIKGKGVLALPLTVTNGSAGPITASLAHEWHGGKWPPTSLYASVTPAGRREPEPFAPAYLAGEDPGAARAVEIGAGGAAAFRVRADWPGTGSCPAVPMIARPGRYVVQLALVLEAGGKRQYALSAPAEVEYAAER